MRNYLCIQKSGSGRRKVTQHKAEPSNEHQDTWWAAPNFLPFLKKEEQGESLPTTTSPRPHRRRPWNFLSPPMLTQSLTCRGLKVFFHHHHQSTSDGEKAGCCCLCCCFLFNSFCPPLLTLPLLELEQRLSASLSLFQCLVSLRRATT